MKKIIVLLVLGVLVSSCSANFVLNSGKSVLKKATEIRNIKNSLKAHAISVQQDLFKNSENQEDYTLFYGVQRIFSFVLLLALLMVVVGTPVLLGFYWIENLFCFHDECKKNVIVNSSNLLSTSKPPCQSDCNKYKKTFSSLYGNGFGFVGWVVFTLWHLIVNFDSFNVGIKSYFNFPFATMKNLDITKNNIFDQVSSEVWASMLLIVGIALVVYIVGRVVGGSIAIRNIKKAQLLIS